MSAAVCVYLVGWWIALFDVSADGRSMWWCIGAAIGCAAWPVLLLKALIELAAAWCARNIE